MSDVLSMLENATNQSISLLDLNRNTAAQIGEEGQPKFQTPEQLN